MRRRTGFTLVELLVVIGIIAVLISVLLPALNRARSQANSVFCMASLRQMGTAITMYAGAHKGRLPLYYWNGDGDANRAGATDWAWLILPYMKSGSSGTYNNTDPGAIWKLFKDKDTLSGAYDTAAWYHSEETQTYSVHSHLFRFAPGPLVSPSNQVYAPALAKPGPEDDGKKPFRLNQIKRSAEIIMVMDAVQIGDALGAPNTWGAHADLWLIQGNGTAWCHNWATLDEANRQWPQGPDAGFNKDYATTDEMTNDAGPGGAAATNIRYRHMRNTQANALFVDGHVGSFRWKKPGLGGSDLQFRNFILDDMYTQDLKFINR